MESLQRRATSTWSFSIRTTLMVLHQATSVIYADSPRSTMSETLPGSFEEPDFTFSRPSVVLLCPSAMKFADPSTQHRVDLNVNDRLGVLNSDLIKRYCQLNPVLVPMIRYIKSWAKPLGLNSPSPVLGRPVTFSSYALVIMTIALLQHRRLLPNLQEGLPPLEPGKLKGTFWLRRPRIICCDVRYNMAEGWTPPEDVPVHLLMKDWFNFWGHEFDYDEEMISIRQGGRLVPSPLASESFNGVFWNIDPFIRSKNITSNIARGSLTRFVSECRYSASRKEFEEGSLPSPKGSARDERSSELHGLKFPAATRDAERILVNDDEFPPDWTRNTLASSPELLARRLSGPATADDVEGEKPPKSSFPADPRHGIASLKRMRKAQTIEKRSVIKSQWLPVEEDELPFAWNGAPPRSIPPANPANPGVLKKDPPLRPQRSPPDISDLNCPVPTPSSESQVFDHDPTLRFDEFGRSMAPEPPLRPPPQVPEEDQVGFGLRR
ncbi:Non-specific serine/threonine protein kinase [Mycena sanguinolenta]|uniref:Non-specific serine/threonine protein kinase n=1 Tax=Mycena sanguinolenta TaxID=230812 RepID=A0A8H7DJH6_9AGAR|nr:Non-specific serine/threonine protein kinase [Mycena sanguinolenta]